MEYTAIGSTVNLASRLCDYAKAGEIICSDLVVEDAGDVCEFEPLSAIRVKGVGREVAIQRVVGLGGISPRMEHGRNTDKQV